MKRVLFISMIGLTGVAFGAQGSALPSSQPSNLKSRSSQTLLKAKKTGSKAPSKSAVLVASNSVAKDAAPAPALQTIVAKSSEEKPEDSKKLTASITLGRSHSLYMVNGESQVASYDYSLSGGYAFDKTYSFAALLEGGYDIKTPEASDLAKGVLSLKRTHGEIFGGRTIFSNTIKTSLPASRAQNSATFLGSVGLDFGFAANPEQLISKKLTLGLTLSGSRSIHKYETGENGKFNTKQSLSQRLLFGWNFTEALSLTVLFDHISAWNYAGALKETYAHNQELGLQLSKSFSVAMGHLYGNPSVSVRSPDTEDFNYKLTDDQNSIVYGSVTYTY